MLFLVTVEAYDLEHVFPSPTVSARGRGGASNFLTLVLLLIQTLIFFLLSPSLLVGGLATSGGRGVRRFRCQKRQGFFDKVVVEVSSREGL